MSKLGIVTSFQVPKMKVGRDITDEPEMMKLKELYGNMTDKERMRTIRHFRARGIENTGENEHE